MAKDGVAYVRTHSEEDPDSQGLWQIYPHGFNMPYAVLPCTVGDDSAIREASDSAAGSFERRFVWEVTTDDEYDVDGNSVVPEVPFVHYYELWVDQAGFPVRGTRRSPATPTRHTNWPLAETTFLGWGKPNTITAPTDAVIPTPTPTPLIEYLRLLRCGDDWGSITGPRSEIVAVAGDSRCSGSYLTSSEFRSFTLSEASSVSFELEHLFTGDETLGLYLLDRVDDDGSIIESGTGQSVSFTARLDAGTYTIEVGVADDASSRVYLRLKVTAETPESGD